jgi:hypothetical protein
VTVIKQRRRRNGEFLQRRSGVRIDPARYDFELARRASTSRELSRRAGVTAVLLSRARHGDPISETNFRKIVTALRAMPVLDGADQLLASPSNRSLKAKAGQSHAEELVG